MELLTTWVGATWAGWDGMVPEGGGGGPLLALPWAGAAPPHAAADLGLDVGRAAAPAVVVVPVSVLDKIKNVIKYTINIYTDFFQAEFKYLI